ncbi:Orn/DAP/Arg decarboxylase 2 [Fragilariopsis cylindrus CCMP1102]|uniref:Orn/DAP/Arg decarboxylase 2 n=1 Tax=Fragilariopsis cylindrus CCMP1102 TaxID=635003 RepID=A0A1E7FJT7_9STRA|nr:Orn/DAP/Arg decarboxylase 2 [Fragilariopsis cylindrus CCMP1102]|eukprot:OEU18440.1 Orn/DAP/Arg decarboxylase 2 [Fragilariopsis cylindrus CCMP1102]
MANAAALCTRIIGVKNNDELSQQQLYIDDGFYGSLSNYPSGGTPLPLKGQSLVRSFSATSKLLSEEALVNTTVWGPTCDGLDKVCSNITLPRLSRDDWLVFPDLGFCNEGTHFNGFSPPDIACCILGG